MTSTARIEAEPVFLLHQRPYRNSSQLLECLSLHHGRVGLIARGSRRQGRGMRALLQPFTPLRMSWSRRGELGNLISVEDGSRAFALSGEHLLAGYYTNELVMALTTRDDPAPELFAHYSNCLGGLGAGERIERCLRLFEYRLLSVLGVGLQLDVDGDAGAPLQAEVHYKFELDGGARKCTVADGIPGAHLIALREERLDDDASLRSARRLLAAALGSQLGARRLKTRDVFADIDARGLMA